MAAKTNDMKKFRGTYTVPITPFTADGRKVDEASGRLPRATTASAPDPAGQCWRVLERHAWRASADRRERGRTGGRPRAGADRHGHGMYAAL